MQLHKINPTDHRHQVVAPLSLAELKALFNALSIDAVTGGGTSPGVDPEALLVKLNAIIQAAEPPQA